MTEQNEVQRLADALDALDDGYSATPRLAAAKLRGLQSDKESLIYLYVKAADDAIKREAVNAQLLEALKMCIKGTRNIGLGVTTLERLDADPESFLNVARSIAGAKEQA